jgi:signal peptidase
MPVKYTTDEQIEAMRRELQAEKQQRKPLGRFGKIFGGILFFFIVILLAGTILSINITKNKGEIPSILGFQLFAVQSGSMEPTLQVGTIILSRRPKNAAGLQVNDIVSFKTSAGDVVTHRIINIVYDPRAGIAYITKGDNPRNSPDQELLTPDRIIGVFVARIPLT